MACAKTIAESRIQEAVKCEDGDTQTHGHDRQTLE